MHPEKYLARERPLAVALPAPHLGPGWKRVARGTIGEFDTSELLRLGVDAASAATAAAGWGGGSYELWNRGSARVMLVRWRWDTPADTREFDAALPLYLTKGLKGTPAGPLRWKLKSGAAAIGVSPSGTMLAFAPSPQQAAALTSRGDRGKAGS
jgi:hypothetical protein